MTKTQEVLAAYIPDLSKNGNKRRRFRNAIYHTINKMIENGDVKVEENVKSKVIGMCAEACLAVESS